MHLVLHDNAVLGVVVTVDEKGGEEVNKEDDAVPTCTVSITSYSALFQKRT
jgi:hypothetical protein